MQDDTMTLNNELKIKLDEVVIAYFKIPRQRFEAGLYWLS
jgi:hypothetical protein